MPATLRKKAVGPTAAPAPFSHQGAFLREETGKTGIFTRAPSISERTNRPSIIKATLRNPIGRSDPLPRRAVASSRKRILRQLTHLHPAHAKPRIHLPLDSFALRPFAACDETGSTASQAHPHPRATLSLRGLYQTTKAKPRLPPAAAFPAQLPPNHHDTPPANSVFRLCLCNNDFVLIILLGIAHMRTAILIAFLTAGTLTGCTSSTYVRHPATWVQVDEQYFTFYAPPDIKSVPAVGIDSLVGKYRCDGISLEFDYGPFSDDLKHSEGTNRIECAEFIGGWQASVVSFRNGVYPVPFDDVVAIHFPQLGAGGSRLTMMASCRTENECATARAIFRTIRTK